MGRWESGESPDFSSQRFSFARPRPVLLVENDPERASLMRRVFRELRIQNPLLILDDVSEAIRFLAPASPWDAPEGLAPALVLVNWQPPRLDGFKLLRWLHPHPELKAQVPVIVHTPDFMPGTAGLVTKLGADRLLLKLPTYDGLRQQIQAVKQKWLSQPAPHFW